MDRRKFIVGSAAAFGLATSTAVILSRRRSQDKHVQIGYTGPATRLSELPEAPQFDVLVIGSGPAGAVTAIEMAKHGAKVAVIEAGMSPAEMARDARFGTLYRCRSVGPVDYPVGVSRVLGVGGTSATWTGRCPRLLPIDFKRNAYSTNGQGWPFTYEEIESFYSKSEALLQVQGQEQADAPRSRNLPNDAVAVSEHGSATRALLGSLSIQTIVTPTSTTSHGDAFRVARDLLPELFALPTSTFIVGAIAHRILVNGNATALGIAARDLDGNTRVIRARTIVLACGAIENARRLMLSRSEAHPNGLGNDYQLVGGSFHEHPILSFRATIKAPRERYANLNYGLLRSFDFYQKFKSDGFGSIVLKAALRPRSKNTYEFKLSTPMEMWTSSANFVRLSRDSEFADAYGDPLPELHLEFSQQDRATMASAHELIRLLYRRVNAANVEEMPTEWGHHHYGTTPMGTDAKTSVVDSNLKVHNINNLYALSSGTFVTSGASNPTLLIVALAYRLSEHILQKLAAGDLPELAG